MDQRSKPSAVPICLSIRISRFGLSMNLNPLNNILSNDHNIMVTIDMPSESNMESEKLNHKRLSCLMRKILVNVGHGIERGELFSKLYKLERGYCGYYTDPCFSSCKKREYDKGYMKAQPVLTKCLLRLVKRGLVELQKHGKVVKYIRLTPTGQEVANVLST